MPANFAVKWHPNSTEFHQSSTIANVENNAFAIGGGSSERRKPLPAPDRRQFSSHGTVTSALATPAPARTGGSSGSVPGVTNAGNGQGLVINVVYDSSVANAPAGFTQTIANVVDFYESQFSTPVTITIDVGYGEIDGQSVEPAALAKAKPT